MKVRLVLQFFCAAVWGGLALAAGPNVLIVLADDCTYNDLPLYGGANAHTPNIDRLAERGLTFNRAYLSSAMCQPCRAELYTGQYPLRNGCAWNHSASRPQTRSLPHYLKPLGYRVGLAGKVHVGPQDAFPFEKVPGFDDNCVRNPTRKHRLGGLREFMQREDGAFALVVALVEPHVPWVMGDASRYPPGDLKLPPNIADTPLTRQHFANYLAEITYMDSQVGEVLGVLRESGLEEDTLVLFTSEQGAQFPGCKWTNWDTGLHTALVAVWPGTVPRGKRTDALVQYADLAPTLVRMAGGVPDGAIEGRSFEAVLRGAADVHRTFVYGMHNNLPEGPAYPIRSISDGEFRYCRNLQSDELFMQRYLMGGGELNNPYWATWMGAPPQRTDVHTLVKRYMLRPAEQLYHTARDPFELHDLARDEAFAAQRARLRAELDRWMEEQADPGAEVDTMPALEAAREGAHLHGIP